MENSLNVVSNRLPVVLNRRDGAWEIEESSGGLVQAMRPLLERGEGRWIGWPGTTEPASDGWPETLGDYSREQSFDLVPVAQSADEYEGFYAGFANRILWPLFHGLVDHCEFETEYWEAYRRMNRRFAEAIDEAREPGDVTWVHDYHLMTVPDYLETSDRGDSVGFFLHIPFPEPETLRRLPWSDAILRGLLGYDLVGFQTRRDLWNFARSVEGGADASTATSDGRVRIEFEGREIEAAPFPISCDFDEFAGLARSEGAQAMLERLEERYAGQSLLLGVDRLDYTKGLIERLQGYERALEKYPELRERVVLYQLVVPSRESVQEYRELRDELERAIGRIQGRFATSTWEPIQYRYTSVDKEELTALYRYADAAVVTPLRDGMNLVSKEYCAAQIDQTGVLILSEFAGSAEQLGEEALTVNPYDTEGLADAIERALEMPRKERTARMHRMRRKIRRADVYWWADTFLDALAERTPDGRARPPAPGARRPGRGARP